MWYLKIMYELKTMKFCVKYEKSENFKRCFLFEVVYCSTLNKNVSYFHLMRNVSLYLVFLYFYVNSEKYCIFKGEF